MPRHAKDQPTVQIDKKRRDALDKFFGLSVKAMKHIEWSLDSTMICTACTVGNERQIIPGKARTAEGKCAFCNSTGYVPDKQQRNWASGEIADRIAPKPKPMEMTIENNVSINELEKEMKSKTVEELKALAIGGGLTVFSPVVTEEVAANE